MTCMNYQKELMNNFSWVHQNCCKKKKKHSEFEWFFPEKKKHEQARVFFLGKTTQTRILFLRQNLFVHTLKNYMQIKRTWEKKNIQMQARFFLCAWSHLHVFFPTTLGYRTSTKAHYLLLFFLNKDSCNHAWTWSCPCSLSFIPLNFSKQHTTNSCFGKTSLPRYDFDVRYLLKVKNTM